ncbi:hypothetical protein ACL7TT_20020 [Microbulbifer sp. 2304DJ12-6]|uniref:hypothetical protein n=1 Tax=Microbulbifer sp. 2304DJ12-6 TaxID=3233340 RepID=UPI0039B0D7F9
MGRLPDGYGPYKFLNTVPSENSPGLLQPSIILRAGFHLDYNLPEVNQTNTSNYHGGWFSDEIAALVSLYLGIRMKAADSTRNFDHGGDPMGRPRNFRVRSEPTIRLDSRSLKLPYSIGHRSLEDLAPLKMLPRLPNREAIAVIRAARLYQDALWCSDQVFLATVF